MNRNLPGRLFSYLNMFSSITKALGIFENQLLPAKAILIFVLKRKQEYETGLTRLTQDSLKC
jgi:hypothetical protein